MSESASNPNKEKTWKRVVLAILPGLAVFGLVLSANYYYDLDATTVKLQEKKEISVSSSESALIVTQSGAGYAAIFTGGYVGIGTTTPATTLQVYGTSTFIGGYVGIGTTTPATTLQVYGTSTFMNGNVGIGTTGPGYKLDVRGDATVGDGVGDAYLGMRHGGNILAGLGTDGSLNLYLGGGSVTDLVFQTASGAKMRIYQAGNVSIGVGDLTVSGGDITLVDGGTIGIGGAKWTFDDTGDDITTAGNVGIGTTSPSSLLELYSTADAGTKLTVTAASSTDPQIVFRAGATPATKFVLGVDYSDSNKFKIATSTIGTDDVLTIDQLGYVGIGTTSPSYKLDVSGGSGIVAQFSGRVIGANAVNSNEFATLAQLSSGGGPWSRTGSYVYLTTSTDSVGIGTSTPAYVLDVYGTSRLGSSTSTQVILRGYVQSDIIPYTDNTYNLGSSGFRWGNIYAATGTFGGTLTINSTDITGSGALNLTGAGASIWRTTSGALTIQSAGDLTATSTSDMIFGTAGTERLRILTNGKIGIGTTTPAYGLDIWGTLRTAHVSTSSGSVIDSFSDETKIAALSSVVVSGGQAKLSQSDCGAYTVTFTYNGGSVTYGTASSSGKCWLDRNLGASGVAASTTDSAAYGDLFQWGREDDGHQVRSPAPGNVEGDMTLTSQPGHANFIKEQTSPYDWATTTWTTRWTVADDDPCPSGWRVPTNTEWNNERLSWSPNNNAAGAFASPLKLTLAGNRYYSSGSLVDVGSNGRYWSSVATGVYACNLGFFSGSADVYNSGRAYGFSVRCVKD